VICVKSQIPTPKPQISNGPAVAGIRRRLPRSATFAIALTIAVVSGLSRTSVRAQEGHPLVGTWHGTWGPNATQRTDVTLVLEYDGKAISGMMNPGPDSVRFDKVTLEPSTWSVHFEATPKQASGKGGPIVIDARIEDITNRHRALVGTFTQGSQKGDFKASRDD
jgi:hypothetical protein